MEGLNSITLNSGMLVSLYEHSLVDITSKSKIKRISVIVVTKTKPDPPQQDFLMQILNACRLEAGDLIIINLSDKKTDLENVIRNASPQYILSFGTGDGTELFTMGNNEGRKYLNAPALEEMMLNTDTSRQMKRKTWNELRLLFGI